MQPAPAVSLMPWPAGHVLLSQVLQCADPASASKPAWQLTHEPWSGAGSWFFWHVAHPLDPALLISLEAHDEQLAAPLAAKVPGTHSRHERRFTSTDPAGHAVQATDPFWAAM